MDTIDFKNEFIHDTKLSYKKCSECGDYKEVSKKYINKISDEVITCLLYTSPSPRDTG